MCITSLDLNINSNKATQKFGWWIEICTIRPLCMYYFGDFDNSWKAVSTICGYVQDLEQEEAEIIGIRIKKCQPEQLTILGNELKSQDLKLFPQCYHTH